MAHAIATGSLPVANVQELAQTCNSSDEQVTRGQVALCDPQSSPEECAKLGSACQQWGFFQLINHWVPDEVICNLRKDIAEFFKLPLETKKAYSQLPNSLVGYGQVFVVSEKQKLVWADMFYLVARPNEARDMRFWPAHPPSFRTSIDRYSSETAEVARCLLEFMANNKEMRADPASLLQMFQGQPQGFRMNYYPPCRQANKIRRDGKWLTVDVLEGAFIVNVGDVLEILSNGKYRSVEHREVVHPDRERISAAVFRRPCQDAVVGPLLELVKDGNSKARYRSVGYMEFMRRYYSAKLDGRNHLESLKYEL
ncbi:S-norcoclaurine synthase 1 [Dichanthelium oligosanthes]|uniref:S-norcoclaurine synthase 1 n=1 Tax=Dichanthelium oligosanthes TaxID=888268 RepID=A0A1E5VYP7_9POAL|nr:S-norcoclaurine synthase 1 [Dichanthelium oligosanthes]